MPDDEKRGVRPIASRRKLAALRKLGVEMFALLCMLPLAGFLAPHVERTPGELARGALLFDPLPIRHVIDIAVRLRAIEQAVAVHLR